MAEELEASTRERFYKTMGNPGATSETAAQASFSERVNGLKKTAETDGILNALNHTNWNRKEASKLLDISYKSLLYRMKVLGLGSKTVVPEKAI